MECLSHKNAYLGKQWIGKDLKVITQEEQENKRN
jgi:hypothetical protein